MMKPSISFREMSTAWTWPRKQVEGGAGDTGLQEGELEDGEDFRWSVVADGDGAVEMLELGGKESSGEAVDDIEDIIMQEDDEGGAEPDVGITRAEVAEDLKIAGTPIPADPCTISWASHSHLYSPEVAACQNMGLNISFEMP